MGLLCVLPAWAGLQYVGFGGIFPARQGCHRSIICEYLVCGSCALERAGTQALPSSASQLTSGIPDWEAAVLHQEGARGIFSCLLPGLILG